MCPCPIPYPRTQETKNPNRCPPDHGLHPQLIWKDTNEYFGKKFNGKIDLVK